MRAFDWPEWDQMFVPDASLLESFLRGTVIYFAILILFRLVLKRQGGGIGLQDMMLVVLVSECVSSGLNAEAKSVTNGVVSVAALLFWSFLVDWASYHWPWLRRQLEPQPLQVVRDGRMLPENMRREQLVEEELAEQLRVQGVDDLSKVKAAYMEPGGELSVIQAEEGAEKAAKKSVLPAEANGRPAEANGRPLRPEPAADGGDDPPDFEQALKQFLEAARSLRAAVDWHESRAAEHRRAAREARDILARHGVRGRKWLDGAGGDPDEARPPTLPVPEPAHERQWQAVRAEGPDAPAVAAEAGPRLADGPAAPVPGPELQGGRQAQGEGRADHRR